MKRIFLTFISIALLALTAWSGERTITVKDNEGNTKQVIVVADTTINGVLVTDTLSIMTYENPAKEKTPTPTSSKGGWTLPDVDGDMVAIVAIVMVFGLPLMVVFFVFYFHYKSRKAKYRLIEQALAAGQPLPPGLFKEEKLENDIRSKGIKNVFLGLGLFIFLWAITDMFELGCIGLLVMFTGFGQLVIHYTGNRKDDAR